jgi:serine/threonine protein kinase
MGTHGRYAIVKKIADGGMAEIFLAKHSGAEGFERLVIVKRILPAFSADPQFRNMLVDEAHIAMTLNHSNIVPVLDLGRSGGRYFLVMELVDGWDVQTILQRARHASFPLPLGLALYVTAEICRGLGYAHSRKRPDGKPLGIVHRDISPQNVIVSEHGEVKVTDFGIAKALGRRDRTKTGVIKGKLDFMSPEQAQGGNLDAASDIFSVGTVLYLLTTRRKPFEAPSDLEALLKVQRGEFTPPEDVAPDLPSKVAKIIKKAMQNKPSDRYRTAEDMLHALEDILRSEFRSPGQSELQRWLGELGSRDKAPTASRLPGLPSSEPNTMPLADEDLIALEDTSTVAQFDETRLRSESDASASPPAHPTPITIQSRAARVFPPGRRRWMLLSVALLASGGLAALSLMPAHKRQEIANKSGFNELLDKGRAIAQKAVTEAERRPDKPLVPTPERKEPERRPDPTPDTKPSDARRPAEARVTITLVTRPPGANVVGPRGSIGRTPMPLTTRVGSTQVLTFAKTGYHPATRKITGDPKKTTVVVALVRQKKKGRR